MKYRLLSILLLFIGTGMVAQELNCRVQVVAPSVANVERRVLDQLKTSIRDFMNDRQWTTDKYTLDERIECNLTLTIDQITNNTQFSGSMQVQSNRIVYNSNYDSPLLNVVDNDISFNYLENTIIEFSLDQHRDNLSSVLAYYAYLILGMDYDTFALEGGTKYLSNAQQIVLNAQNSNSAGWKAFESQKNRYWIVENHLHQQFKPLRSALYDYHRLGLDKMYENTNLGRNKVTQSLQSLKKVHQARPLSYNLRIFFLAKADELVNIYSGAADLEQTGVYNIVQLIDPANLSKYASLKSSK